jgi:hypothetical protein
MMGGKNDELDKAIKVYDSLDANKTAEVIAQKKK